MLVVMVVMVVMVVTLQCQLSDEKWQSSVRTRHVITYRSLLGLILTITIETTV